MKTILFVIAGLGAGLLLAVAGALRRPLVQLVRMLLKGLVALLALAGAAVTAAGISNEAWWAVILGGGMLLIALRLGWALMRPRRRRHGPGDVEHVPLTRAEPESRWGRFEAELDWVGRQQARRARTAIDGLLAEAKSPSLTNDQRALILSCEKRIPQLLETVDERCRNASRQERQRYVDETLNRLVQIGSEAEQARRDIRAADDRRLETLHRYFDGVAGRDEDRPPPR